MPVLHQITVQVVKLRDGPEIVCKSIIAGCEVLLEYRQACIPGVPDAMNNFRVGQRDADNSDHHHVKWHFVCNAIGVTVQQRDLLKIGFPDLFENARRVGIQVLVLEVVGRAEEMTGSQRKQRVEFTRAVNLGVTGNDFFHQ